MNVVIATQRADSHDGPERRVSIGNQKESAWTARFVAFTNGAGLRSL